MYAYGQNSQLPYYSSLKMKDFRTLACRLLKIVERRLESVPFWLSKTIVALNSHQMQCEFSMKTRLANVRCCISIMLTYRLKLSDFYGGQITRVQTLPGARLGLLAATSIRPTEMQGGLKEQDSPKRAYTSITAWFIAMSMSPRPKQKWGKTSRAFFSTWLHLYRAYESRDRWRMK